MHEGIDPKARDMPTPSQDHVHAPIFMACSVPRGQPVDGPRLTPSCNRQDGGPMVRSLSWFAPVRCARRRRTAMNPAATYSPA